VVKGITVAGVGGTCFDFFVKMFVRTFLNLAPNDGCTG